MDATVSLAIRGFHLTDFVLRPDECEDSSNFSYLQGGEESIFSSLLIVWFSKSGMCAIQNWECLLKFNSVSELNVVSSRAVEKHI